MPWKTETTMSLKMELLTMLQQPERNVSQLSRRFGVSRKTIYKWQARLALQGQAGLAERSSRPHHSPGRTSQRLEERIIQLRQRHPAWGGRKLRRRLQDLGCLEVPAASTITAILQRHQLISAHASA